MLIGLPGADESEGFDRTHMNLPANQLAALQAVAAANPNVVVVLVNGSTVVLGDVTPHAVALVEAWLGGQAAGGAIADVLSGKVNPSGRLAETVPHRLEDNSSLPELPGRLAGRALRRGAVHRLPRLRQGRTSTSRSRSGSACPTPRFELSDLAVATSGSVADGSLAAEVTVTVTNTGPVAGAEVVQVYVRDVEASVARPVRELKGFTKVALDPGESRQVHLTLDQRAFSFWSDLLGRWVVEAGEFAVEVGHHSRDLPLTADRHRRRAVDRRPADRRLHPARVDGRPGRPSSSSRRPSPRGQPDPTQDAELVAVIGTMPMSTLAAFRGMSIDHDTLDKLVERWRDRTGQP